MKAITIAVFLLCLVGPSFQQNPTTSYAAGVIELFGTVTPDSTEAFRLNTENYLRLLSTPRALESHIVVFPESTLNNVETAIIVPRSEERIIPCNNESYHIHLQNISCAAQINRQYVVVNLVMQRNCSEEAIENNDDRPCSGEWNLYNTNVVFDTNGMVISTYRKFNLHDNEPYNRTLVPDISTFTTNFGVTFGHFIGSDILFNSPAMDLVRQNVQNFVYPTRLSSEVPFLTAVQIQEGWAIVNNVNLLAASANQPAAGRSGSGIYSGNFGALQSFVTGAPAEVLLTSDVPRVPGPLPDTIVNQETGIQLHNLQLIEGGLSPNSFEHQFINTANVTEHNIRLCQESTVNEFCCNFRIQTVLHDPQVEPVNPFLYIAAVFNGNRTFGDAEEESYLRICTILACTTNNIATCGTVRPTEGNVRANNFNFTTIHITAEGVGRSLDDVTDTAMPNTLVMNMLTLPRAYYNYQEDSVDNDWEFSTAEMSLVGGSRNDILTFGIYVRDHTFSAAVKIYAPVGLLMTLIVFFMLLFK